MRAVAVGVIAAALLSYGGATASAQSAATPKAGQHEMEGQVTRVDAKKGWVHVKTSEGTMIVHFPPSDLQDLRKGDTVTVYLALKDNGPAPKK
jgi:hypothetical protein